MKSINQNIQSCLYLRLTKNDDLVKKHTESHYSF